MEVLFIKSVWYFRSIYILYLNGYVASKTIKGEPHSLRDMICEMIAWSKMHHDLKLPASPIFPMGVSQIALL